MAKPEAYIDKAGVQHVVFTPANDQEEKAYRSLLEMDKPICPRCKKPLNPPVQNLKFEVTNPLTQDEGMDLAMFKPICNNCGGTIELMDEFDLMPAFPTAVGILKKARENYKRMKNRGGTNGKA